MNTRLGITHCGNTEFRWGERTYVMGIVNVTPDSFSGDGLGSGPEAALEQAIRFVDDGADIIDIGGESTRPKSEPITVEEELRRVIPVIEKLASGISVPISVDTYRSEVARQAVVAGAKMINDVWGLQKDPLIAEVAAEYEVPVVITQNQRGTAYDNLLPDIIESLKKSIEIALNYGVKRENIIIDPGIGFGKNMEQNLEIIRKLSSLTSLGRPILLGISRKSVIGLVLDLPVDQRLEGTAATVAIGIANGADIVRVHDVKEMVRVVKMSDAVIRVASE